MDVPSIISTTLVVFGGYQALKLILKREPKPAAKQVLHQKTASSVKIQVDSAVNTMGRSDLPQDATVASARRQVDGANEAAVASHPALAAIYDNLQTF